MNVDRLDPAEMPEMMMMMMYDDDVYGGFHLDDMLDEKSSRLVHGDFFNEFTDDFDTEADISVATGRK